MEVPLLQPGGSRVFAGLAQGLGLSVDETNYILGQVFSLALATLYRTSLHHSKVSKEARYWFGLVFGVVIGYFCFGYQAVHLVTLPGLCYLILITQNEHLVQKIVLVVAMLYLSVLHLSRQFYSEYGSYGLDVTGPLMVITQKVTSLAFSLHDGRTKTKDKMTEMQKKFAIDQVPSALEYFSYVLLFPSLMAGPIIYYKDYITFIEGKESKGQPSPLIAVIKKVLLSMLFVVGFLKLLPKYPIDRIKDESFIDNTNVTDKFLYLMLTTTFTRFKYYFAWILSDAICNNCGIGFNGFDENGFAKWDGISNVDVFKFEFATSLKEAIEAWNKGTNVWLRFVVYERAKKNRTILTYILSALWHGFYPGYYITFLSGALFTFAARNIRRSIRGYFTENPEAKHFYDFVTFLVTRLVMGYLTFTFVLLEFWASIRILNQLYWSLHIMAGLTIFLLPKLLPKGTKNETVRNGIAKALSQAGPYSNGLVNAD